MIEVKVQAAFEQWKLGQLLQVDETDPRISALLGVGYLQQTSCFEENVAKVQAGFDAAVKSVTRKPRKKKVVSDGEDQSGFDTGVAGGQTQSSADGVETVPAGSDGI